MQSDRSNTTEKPWWYGMSTPDLCVYLIRRDGPLSATQIGIIMVESGFTTVAKPRVAATDAIKRAVAKGQLRRIEVGLYGLAE